MHYELQTGGAQDKAAAAVELMQELSWQNQAQQLAEIVDAL